MAESRIVLPPERLRPLLVCLALLVLPHLFHLPWSPMLLFLGFWIWRWAALSRPRLLPRRLWLPFLALGAAVAVIASRGGMVDLTTGTGLIVAGLGLKLMELNGERDVYFTVFLGWFVALTQFLYGQSLAMAFYALVAAGLPAAVLVRFNAARPLPWFLVARAVAGLMLPALPLMVVLFLFFPRVHAPFIHLAFGTQARTGLADVMEPGAIARLAASAEVAFRVDFDGPLPPPEQRYWRAQVFWRFDGRRWLPLAALQRPLPAPFPGTGPRYRYHVTVEPHHHRWLFSLGLPASVPAAAYLTREGVLRARFPVDERMRYPLVSHTRYRFPPLSPVEREAALQLPAPPTPRVQVLVRKLREQGGDPRRFAAAVLAHFRDHGFRYTLRPARLGARPIDRFLFETREGFCEHYATAFVYLMRAAGIPARVVAGYLGGFFNPRGRFLEVYQANAHAWAEVWMEGSGWVCYDPTQAVAPRYVARVRDLPDPPSADTAPRILARSQSQSSPQRGERRPWWRELGRSTRILWADLDHRWHRWVLDYDRQAQFRLFAWLKPRWPWVVLMLAVGVAVLARHCKGGAGDPLLREYQVFLRRLQRWGMHKQAQETPLAFARRACRHCPEEEAERIRLVTEAFVQARYGRKSRAEAARTIRRLLKRG